MMVLPHDQSSHQLSSIRHALQSGDVSKARQIAEQALANAPENAILANAAGDLALKCGDVETAKARFRKAIQLQPGNIDFQLNYAIALQRLDEHHKALDLLRTCETEGREIPRYASMRAMSHRALGQLAEASHWYDIVLTLDGKHPRGLHGRARIALERGDGDAVERFDAALAHNPQDLDMWLGKAQAFEVAGDKNGAREIAERLVALAPTFVPGVRYASELLLSDGHPDFASPFRKARQLAPRDPNIALHHVETLAGLDFYAQAADEAAVAGRTFPQEPIFTLLEAAYASSAGENERASSLFASLPSDLPGRYVHEARFALRTQDFSRADMLLSKAIDDHPWDISAWALRGIVWRLLEHPQAQWLHGQAGLVQLRPLVGHRNLIDDVIAALRALHENAGKPLGQSVRGGTQTRGVLLQRKEPIFHDLKQAIDATLHEYRNNLPAEDPSHPLLRHRTAPWSTGGSWSVRLTGNGDHHTAHIHPQGVISSALYLVVPEEVEGADEEGWLEIGRPKPDLALNLEPIQTIKPKVGHLALFPSTVYHGTTPFRSAERMTVAFDVMPAQGRGHG